MKHFWKRLIACALTVIMLLSVMPPAAYAAVGELVTRSGLENAALLEALRQVYGDDAEAYLAVLEQYGLVDEDGNFVTDEKIVMNGVEYTLDEIEAVLDDPSTDLSTVVEVDGTYLTLEELKTIVEIERYLAYVKATYFTEQDLTDEQTASFYDLMDAWANGGLRMLSANSLSGVGPAGVDHGVRLSVTAGNTATVGGTYTVTVTASSSAAPNQEITFDWRAVSGSVNATGGGTETVKPGETRTLSVSVDDVKGRTQGNATFVVQIYNVKNALLSDGSTRWEKTVSVAGGDTLKYSDSQKIVMNTPQKKGKGNERWTSSSSGKEYCTSPEVLNITIDDLQIETEEMTFSGLNAGTYAAAVTVNQLDVDAYMDTANSGDAAGYMWYHSNGAKSFKQVNALTGPGTPGASSELGGDFRFTLNGEKAVEGTIAYNYSLTHMAGIQTVRPASTVELNTAYQADSKYKVGLGFSLATFLLEDNSMAKFWYYDIIPRVVSVDAVLSVHEVTKNTDVSFSIPEGTYYAGQSVPITAVFGFPVKITNGMTITVNGNKTLTPVEIGTTGETCTFLYPVDETSGGSVTITQTSFVGGANAGKVKGANDLGMTVNLSGSSPIKVGSEAPGVKLESIDREKAFGDPRLTVTKDENNKPQLNVAVPLSTNKKYTAWVLSEISGTTLNALQVMTDQTETDKYAFEVNDTQPPTELTATIPLPYNTSTDAIDLTVDFFLDGAVWMGRGLTTQVEGSIPVKVGDFTPGLILTPSGGERQEYRPGDEVPLLYAQQNNSLELFVTLKPGSYTWGNTSRITYYNEAGSPADETAHFAWKSSDPSVAAVSVQDGRVVLAPTGAAGTTEITLTALNGGMMAAESDPITVRFDVGQDPFLLIPESGKTIRIREGQDAVVNWTSNICAKNETAGAPTVFTVSLYSGTENRTTPAWTTELTTDENNRIISSATIPWDTALKEIYRANVRTATVTVSAMYNGVTYGSYQDEMQNWYDSATATISMISQPASVTLDEPAGSLYQTDGGSGKQITLTWTVPHLDTTPTGGGKFELYIAGGRLDAPIVKTALNDERGGPGVVTQSGETYSYTLDVPAVDLSGSDPARYRDSYSITVKAKNSAESTWAYDSYVLYVYSDSALRLLLDGAKAEDSLKMSNWEKIAELWGDGGQSGSENIVALQRDIALKNVISINYGEYAWAELADQIAWNSSDSAVATVNYQQGTLYENIENFSYTSYRPSTDFILSGLKDGTTTITAQHVKTGITDSVTVNVETLRDQLYLFQCYPKAVTTLTYEVYTNGNRTATEQMTLNTNANGEAAIYAPYGLAGDVYCMSNVKENGEKVTYLGTIYNRSLVSSEADSTKLQLYPVNTLRLRRAAQAEIYLKNPDGTPYANQQVIFRGGVYRQGEYCDLNTVQFGLQNKVRDQWKLGNERQTATTGPDGRLLVTMDLMQFKTDLEQEEVQAGEKLYYLFQLEYGDGSSAACYPLFLRVDASLNLDDIAASGDSIVAWETNDSNAKGPFIAQQTLKYSPNANANVADIRKNTGSVGPSSTFPTAYLTTSVMWWGDEHAGDQGRVNSVLLQDTTGKTPDCQTSKVITYPFTDLVFTENVMTMDESAMRKWGIGQGEKRNVQAVLSEDGETASRTISLPFKIVNMIGIKKAEDSETLPEALKDVKSSLSVNANADGGISSLGDKLIQSGMKMLASDAKYDPDESRDRFMVRLYATSDPTVFRALICLSGGNMSSGHNVTGVYPEYGNTEDMTFVNVDSPDGGMKNSDKGLLPNPMNIYDMAKGRYMDKVNNEGRQAASGKGVRSFNMDLGGYFEADIAYNHESGAWECRPITGGFHVGGGLNYTWNFNSMVGPVPITASVTLGGTLEVRLDVQASRYVHVFRGEDAVDAAVSANDEAAFKAALAEASTSYRTDTDYLTSLRLFLYIRAFAGVGFDYSVVAFKIGVFGQLDIDLQFRWLNRNYLEPHRFDRYSMAGPVNSRDDEVMFGSKASVSGSTGIEFVFKFLFISYEKILCSVGFKAGQSIEDWDTIEEIWAANKKINNQPVTRMAMPNGQVMYAVDLGAQMESRDYVDACEQVWLGGVPSMSLFSLDKNQSATLAGVLQTGAYSYANPVLSDDGEVMFYLSDRPADGTDAQAKDLTNTRVAVSTKSGAQFTEGKRFDNDNSVATGYGDSGVKVAGSRDSYAAVWVRQMENFTLSSGDGGTLDEGQQMLQMNSTEIIAATSSDGNSWILHRLTNNSTPDLAPVVAASGDRIVAAWREVSSTSAADLTSFDQQDAIRFAIYEGGKWSETQTLYDGTGTAASVKGIEAAMLSDGTAAVVYTLDTNAQNDSNTDWETALALIPADEASAYGAEDSGSQSEDTVRIFRLTTNSDLDENPQITTARFGSTERFVVAWHTERAVADSDETESDIRLAAMGADGVLYENMPESLSMATGGTGDTIGSNFRFAKNAGSIDDLSILWVDSVSGDTDDKQYSDIWDGAAAGYKNTGHDVLKAVKFVKDGSSYTLSGTVEVAEMAEMADNTLIDHFDAYMDSGKIKSVILGTNYSDTTKRKVTVSDGTTDQVMTMEVANPVSGMYAATAEFTNRVEESAVMLEYEKLYPNSDIDVQFTIRNSGKEPITKLEITAGNEKVYTSETLDSTNALNLLPNRDITVTAKIPTGAAIENVDYVIKATFGGGEEVSLPGTLYLDIPDVGVSKVETIKEAGGERTLRYSLYNALSARLADVGDKWQVQVGFYADQGCTELLKDKGGQNLIRTIADKDDLALIDGGGYSAEVTLPAASYVTAGEEIPSGGISVYVKAWVEAPVKTRSRADSYDTVYEYYQGNNETSLHLDNLALRRGEDVTLQSTMNNSGDTTSVTVDVQYNKLTGTTSGNLIVTLLDADGQPLEKLQSYTQQNDLLTLSEEGTAEKTFTFSQKGADVKVEFSDLILGGNSVELDHVSLTEATVTYDPDIKTYTATGAGLTSSILNIAPKDPANATITLTGASYDANGTPVNNLRIGRNEWTITVTNGSNTETYQLVLNNADPNSWTDPEGPTDPNRPGTGGSSGGSSSSYAVTVTKPEHGKVTASPTNANSGSTVTLTVTPDSGYMLDTLTVTDSRGNEIKLTAQGGGKYTFTMPSRAVTIKATFSPLPGDATKPCDGGADCPSRAFTDLGGVGTWYHEAVDYALRNNLMGGYGKGLFGPNNNLTRAQLAQILYNREGRPAVSGSSPFTDVANGAWYSDAITWAAANGIVSGYGGGKFGPNDNITREQLAAILWRYSKSPAAANKELHFNDADEISGYALDAIRWAVEHGILNGFGDGRLGPKGLATRAQVAQMLKNFIENQEDNI